MTKSLSYLLQIFGAVLVVLTIGILLTSDFSSISGLQYAPSNPRSPTAGTTIGTDNLRDRCYASEDPNSTALRRGNKPAIPGFTIEGVAYHDISDILSSATSMNLIEVRRIENPPYPAGPRSLDGSPTNGNDVITNFTYTMPGSNTPLPLRGVNCHADWGIDDDHPTFNNLVNVPGLTSTSTPNPGAGTTPTPTNGPGAGPAPSGGTTEQPLGGGGSGSGSGSGGGNPRGGTPVTPTPTPTTPSIYTAVLEESYCSRNKMVFQNYGGTTIQTFNVTYPFKWKLPQCLTVKFNGPDGPAYVPTGVDQPMDVFSPGSPSSIVVNIPLTPIPPGTSTFVEADLII